MQLGMSERTTLAIGEALAGRGAGSAFARLRSALGDLLFAGSGSGLLVNNFATVNAGAGVAAAGEAFAGRLYGVLIGPSVEELDELDHRITERLATLTTD